MTDTSTVDVSTDEESRRNEALDEVILESALDCIIIANHEGRIIEFNPAAEKTLGYTRAQVVGKLLDETILPPSLREAHRREIAHYLATGESLVLGKRIKTTAMHADGSEFPIELAITPIHSEKQPAFVAYLRDITERKQSEDTLRRLGKAVEQSIDGIIVTDMEWKIQSANDAMAKMHGCYVEELLGKHLSILHNEEQMQKEVLPFIEQVEKTDSYQGEIGHVRKDDTTFSSWKTITTLRDEEGSAIGYVGIARDITILLDVELPDGNGRDLLPIPRSHEPPIPVVIFSAQEAITETVTDVAATLVKSRTSNTELLETIQSLIKPNMALC